MAPVGKQTVSSYQSLGLVSFDDAEMTTAADTTILCVGSVVSVKLQEEFLNVMHLSAVQKVKGCTTNWL